MPQWVSIACKWEILTFSDTTGCPKGFCGGGGLEEQRYDDSSFKIQCGVHKVVFLKTEYKPEPGSVSMMHSLIQKLRNAYSLTPVM